MRLLAFSSSRAGNGAYLQTALPELTSFLGDQPHRIAFVPFASVDGYAAYTANVTEGLSSLPHTITPVTESTAAEVIGNATAIMVGGGNTFKLLHHLYHYNLLNLIKEKVAAGVPYIGWSAGANLAGPTICTTNDMPIIEPESFAAFGFLPFQLNPHYHSQPTPGFNGETRDQRLEEFLKLSPGVPVVCLPEGTAIRVYNGKTTFVGEAQGTIMTREGGQTIHQIIDPGASLSYLAPQRSNQ